MSIFLRGFAGAALRVGGAGCSQPAPAQTQTQTQMQEDAQKPIKTQVVPQAGGFQLMRDGKPYLIKGAGGDGSKPQLKSLGANSFRTWGADNLDGQLDEAQKLGLSVTVGIWLGHKEQGFNYDDPAQVASQLQTAKAAIDRYKNHPAVLMWGIGNEMEGYGATTDPKMWAVVQEIAAYAHKVDPNHPTMTVVAEIGGDKVPSINKYCPDIDVVGINSYAGGPSIPDRYKKAGGTKPYVMTEYGPPGTWEMKKNDWGAVPEPSSTEKANSYLQTYKKAIANQPLSLGGYAFTWGNKQEASATWFGMLLPDGTHLGATDALSEEWTGKAPQNRVPEVKSLALETPGKTTPSATVKAKLNASDPENNTYKVQWVLQADPMTESVGGQTQAVPPTYPEAIQSSSNSEATIKMPPYGGGYRLFAYLRDEKGGGAVANVPMFVEGGDKAPAGNAAKTTLPFTLSGDDAGNSTYVASGYMGNAGAIKMSETTDKPHSGKTATKVEYNAADNWGGVVWQSPANDWGDAPGGLNLTGAKKLTFWARGDKGGEEVSFSFGLLGKDKKYPDSAKGETGKVKLSTDWQQFTIDLTGKDLSQIKTGFSWVVAGNGAPMTFYLDDIKFE